MQEQLLTLFPETPLLEWVQEGAIAEPLLEWVSGICEKPGGIPVLPYCSKLRLLSR